MSIERPTRDGPITFTCDAPKCHEVHATGHEEFRDALEEIKANGWVIFKAGDDWRHICGDHNRGDMSRNDLIASVTPKPKWKPRWAR